MTLPLFGDDTEAYAKRADPITSWEAARSLSSDDLTARQQAVLKVLGAIGPTHNDQLVIEYNRLAFKWFLPGQTDQSIRSRRSELTDMGAVADSGEKVFLPTGRRAIVWKVVAP